MSDEQASNLTDEERLLFGAYDLAADLALRCRQLRELNLPSSEAALERVVTFLVTEFWDQAFPQTQIRTAFNAALSDMNRYAGGQERR